eukprot:XP_002937730.1 PREDICTED: uncharacterized protein LOC100497954 [Xenopus tropicalis]
MCWEAMASFLTRISCFACRTEKTLSTNSLQVICLAEQMPRKEKQISELQKNNNELVDLIQRVNKKITSAQDTVAEIKAQLLSMNEVAIHLAQENNNTEIQDKKNPEEFGKDDIESLKSVIGIKNKLLRKQENQLLQYRDMVKDNLIVDNKALEQENQVLRMQSKRKTSGNLFWTIKNLNTLIDEVNGVSDPPSI